ncbi:MAG: lipopolysaccharide biosynthesis protein [Oscillospiraceae bacterium]|nr:lipopolysaccharide biosynthesis protein [Oscillospiraceae bacterium]
MDRKSKVISNLIWRFFERCGSQLVSFAVSIVLARILEPSFYAPISKVTVITAILMVFVDSGMANALIQKKDPDDLDFSSVFYFNVCFCLLLYALLFLAAPFIAAFYRSPELTPIVRVLGLTVVVAGVKNVQQAYVSKTLQFKRFFFATLGGTLFSAVLGISMARGGFGVWALVAQQLSNVAVNTVILWFTVGWRPRRMFSLQRLRGLLGYGWKLLSASLLDTVYLQLYPLIIGVRYADADLAFFERGRNWPNLVVENINYSIDSVLLPVMSSQQDHRDQVREMTRRAIKTSSYIMMPLMAGLAVCAEPLVRLLMTEKWLPAVPFLQIFCAVYAFYPLHTANLNAIKAMGRSDVFLKLEVIKKVLETLILLVTMRFGVFAMALGQLCSGLAAQLINAWPNRRLLNYAYLQQLRDMAPAVLLSLAMAAVVYAVRFLGLGDLLTLLLQIPLGAAVYIAGSVLLRVDSFQYILSIVRRFLPGRGKELRE